MRKEISCNGRMVELCIAIVLSVGGTTAVAQTGTHDWSTAQQFANGVQYAQLTVSSPRLMNVYCLRIDGGNPWVQFRTTGRGTPWVDGSTETLRNTTRNFVGERLFAGDDMIAAVNADAFSPWPVPWNQQSLTNLLGLAVSDGVLVSSASGTPSFVVFNDGTMTITSSVGSIANVNVAVSGFGMVLVNGSTVAGGASLAPRTGVGLSADEKVAYFMVIDGRRTESEGATTEEVGAWLRYFGADDGINMDGGGSSTMARFNPKNPGAGVLLLNDPVGNGAPNCTGCASTERNNGNNIGVYMAEDNDNDFLPDYTETDTGMFVDLFDTGTDPNNPDSDGDGLPDGIEVAGGLDPNNPADGLALPVGGTWRTGVTATLVGAIGAVAAAVTMKRRSIRRSFR